MNHYLSDRDVAARYHVSRQCVWRWARDGKLPSPVKLTTGCTRWTLAEIEAWERDRAAEAGKEAVA